MASFFIQVEYGVKSDILLEHLEQKSFHLMIFFMTTWKQEIESQRKKQKDPALAQFEILQILSA